MDPLTIVQYKVDCADIVDLTDSDVRATLGIEVSDMSGGWKSLPGDDAIPPTWDIADALIEGGAAGILVPSFALDAKPAHHNLVLWDWSNVPPHQVLVHDPEGKLPRDDSSWRTDNE
jgi:RES domain-containing protein